MGQNLTTIPQHKYHATALDDILYRKEENRLESFKRWKNSNGDPKQLANSGLYFTGIADICKCFECEIEISDWIESDDPWSQHQRKNGRCRFIRRYPCGNVPIGADEQKIPLNFKTPEICKLYRVEHRPIAGIAPKWRINECNNRKDLENNGGINSNRGLCKICLNDSINVVILPCFHAFSCNNCIESLNRCAICRNYIGVKIPFYLA